MKTKLTLILAIALPLLTAAQGLRVPRLARGGGPAGLERVDLICTLNPSELGTNTYDFVINAINVHHNFFVARGTVDFTSRQLLEEWTFAKVTANYGQHVIEYFPETDYYIEIDQFVRLDLAEFRKMVDKAMRPIPAGDEWQANRAADKRKIDSFFEAKQIGPSAIGLQQSLAKSKPYSYTNTSHAVSIDRLHPTGTSSNLIRRVRDTQGERIELLLYDFNLKELLPKAIVTTGCTRIKNKNKPGGIFTSDDGRVIAVRLDSPEFLAGVMPKMNKRDVEQVLADGGDPRGNYENDTWIVHKTFMLEFLGQNPEK